MLICFMLKSHFYDIGNAQRNITTWKDYQIGTFFSMSFIAEKYSVTW
jgi:hypothetical protein